MSDLAPERIAFLQNKYPAMSNHSPMDPSASTQVRAVLRARDIVHRVWGDEKDSVARLAEVLFDPARVPTFASVADAAAADFHSRTEEFGRMHYDTADTDYDPHDPAEQGAVRIWRVGSNYVTIVRDRWHAPNPHHDGTVEFAADPLDLETSLLDRWECGCMGYCDCDRRCNVHQPGRSGGGTTRLLPVVRGTLVLMLRCCETCEAQAARIAETNFKISVLEAQAKLPRGAVIDPRSPVPPTL
jgi:hypothetical protein